MQPIHGMSKCLLTYYKVALCIKKEGFVYQEEVKRSVSKEGFVYQEGAKQSKLQCKSFLSRTVPVMGALSALFCVLSH